jgi:hypothetical protein
MRRGVFAWLPIIPNVGLVGFNCGAEPNSICGVECLESQLKIRPLRELKIFQDGQLQVLSSITPFGVIRH